MTIPLVTRILVAGDHPIVRSGLTASAGTGEPFLERSRAWSSYASSLGQPRRRHGAG